MTTAHRKRDIEHFEHWSHTYEDSWMQHAFFDPAHQGVLALAAGMVPHPANVLDIGCGTGRLLRRARTFWPETQLIGVDPASGMIEMAKRLTPDATFLQGRGEELPLQDASVDLALSTLSFHHWGDQAAGLREIARVLRPGGYFFLLDLSLPGWLLWLFRARRVHSRARLQALFTQAGLQVQRQQKIAGRGRLVTVSMK